MSVCHLSGFQLPSSESYRVPDGFLARASGEGGEGAVGKRCGFWVQCNHDRQLSTPFLLQNCFSFLPVRLPQMQMKDFEGYAVTEKSLGNRIP